MATKNILFVGLPESGKSTFIGALWNYINSDYEDKSIELNSLENSENIYLDGLADKWTSCEVIDRNYRTTPIRDVVMNVKIINKNEVVFLETPDLSGELIQDQFENREWSIDYKNIIDDISGVILFLSVLNSNNKPTLTIRANEIEKELGHFDEFSDDSKGVEYKHKFTSNQVKLVEALQLIEYYKNNFKSLRVAVVVSAWDSAMRIHGSNFLPEKWVADECPLLFQFLQSNNDKFNYIYFGISAQGGDYNLEKEQLIRKELMDRIIVVDENEITSDIAKPILWVTE